MKIKSIRSSSFHHYSYSLRPIISFRCCGVLLSKEIICRSGLSLRNNPRLESLNLHYSNNLVQTAVFNYVHLAALELPYLNSLHELAKNPKLSTVTHELYYQAQGSGEDQDWRSQSLSQTGLAWYWRHFSPQFVLLQTPLCPPFWFRHLKLTSSRRHDRIWLYY